MIATSLVRLPEPCHLTLRSIAAHWPSAMQRCLQDVIAAASNQQIVALTDNPSQGCGGRQHDRGVAVAKKTPHNGF
jgi:hypothetical protein